MRATLELTLPAGLTVDLRALSPRDVLALSTAEIEKLTAPVGGRETLLGEFCKVTCEARGNGELVLAGDTVCAVYAGYRLNGVRLVVNGDAGPFAGAEMCGGELEIFGNAADCCGAALHGGLLRVHGSAGNWCGAALPGQPRGMDGGTIIVDGNAGAEVGSAMRRGLVWVSGDAAEYAGARMLVGTIFVAGKAGAGAGLGIRRGSLAVGKLEHVLPGFRSAGRADDVWLRVYFQHLKKFGIAAPSTWLDGGMQRFTGDPLELDKGEIIVHEIAQ
jgi:formylmethanofuran dehydrogenase subunit C